MTDIKTNASEGKPTLGERLFGVAAYLSWFSPLAFFAPLVLYYWKGRTSRFIGFHAIQSTLLAFTIVLLDVGLTVLTVAVMNVANGNAAAWAVYWLAIAVMVALPLVSAVWMSVSVILDRPAVLPVFGRWAKQITAPA